MITEISSKACPRCGENKPIGDFGRDCSRRDGLACWCKGCLNANSRKWHATNRESALQRHRQWYAQNPPDRAAVAARTKRWREENPDHARSLRKNGKHLRRSRTRGGITASELREWEAEQRKICHWCGERCDHAYQIDHRFPLAKGGKHERRNLVISCPPCNRRKGARCPVEFAQSLGRLA